MDLDPIETLQRIHVARAYNSSHQMLLVEKAQEVFDQDQAQKIGEKLLLACSTAAELGTSVERLRVVLPSPAELARYELADLMVVVDVVPSEIAGVARQVSPSGFVATTEKAAPTGTYAYEAAPVKGVRATKRKVAKKR